MRKRLLVPCAMLIALGVGGAKEPSRAATGQPSKAAGQPSKAATGRTWTPEEVTGLAKACADSYGRNGVRGPRAERMCRCVATGMSQVLPPGWLDDGQPVSESEKRMVGAITTGCAEQSSQVIATVTA